MFNTDQKQNLIEIIIRKTNNDEKDDADNDDDNDNDDDDDHDNDNDDNKNDHYHKYAIDDSRKEVERRGMILVIRMTSII
jgi:ABC-type Zn2+ transport system substrate-binding protein/surface adhesin